MFFTASILSSALNKSPVAEKNRWKMYAAAFVLDVAILATLLVIGLLALPQQFAFGLVTFSAIVLPFSLMAGPFVIFLEKLGFMIKEQNKKMPYHRIYFSWEQIIVKFNEQGPVSD